MKHITALLVKFLMVAVVLEIILSLFTNLTFGNILYISAAVTILAYIVGDLLILPASNNTIATIADIFLALATIYAFNFWGNNRYISFTSSLISAIVIGLGEWFFHKYMYNNILPNKTKE